MMRNAFALCALALLLSSPALGQNPPSRGLGQDAPQGISRLPLDAMLHHPPRAGDVARRESDRAGDRDEDLRRRKAELDALYNDIMARSAPKK
jgi:hypothetical protein